MVVIFITFVLKKKSVLKRVTSHGAQRVDITFCCSLLKKLLGYRIIHAGSQPANPVARNVHDDDAESKVRGVVQERCNESRERQDRRETRMRE